MKRTMMAAALGLMLGIGLGAQSKPALTRADYGQWESLSAGGRGGGFSPDGRWLSYGLTRTNRANEVRIVKVADGTTVPVPFGAQVAFSSDSAWAAYSIGYSDAEQEQLRPDAARHGRDHRGGRD
jgi:hypothetical protein